jgi:hypothetical protein
MQPVFWIRDVYSGSRILIFIHPGSQIQQQKMFCLFVATNFTKWKLFYF